MPVVKVNTREERLKANINPNDFADWAKFDF